MTFKRIQGFFGLQNSFKILWRLGGVYYETNNRIDFAHFILKALFNFINAIWFTVTILNNKNNVGILGEAMHGFVASLGVKGAAWVFWIKKENFEYILKNYNRTYEYESPLVEEYSKKIMKRKSKTLKKLFNYSAVASVVISLNNTIVAYASKYLMGEKIVLLFPVSTPINYENKLWYFFVLIWQIFYHCEVVATIFASSSFIYFIMITLSAEFDILKFALTNTERRIQEKNPNFLNSSISNSISIRCFNDLIKHHIEIIRYFEHAKTCLAFYFLLVVMDGIALTAAVGFILLLAEFGVKVKFLVMSSFQVIFLGLMCLQGQILSDKSEEIRLKAYEIGFWNFPKSCWSHIMMLLIWTSKPLCYTTTIGNAIGFPMFTTIMQGVFTYFNSLTQLF